MLSFDDSAATIIRGVIDVGCFSGPYSLIATRIYDYVDRYKKAPGDHLADILADKLEAKDGNLYADTIASIYESRTGLNKPYVMGQMENFVRRQALRSVAVDLHKALTRDTEESLDEADRLIQRATRRQIQVFDPGIRLSDKKRALNFLDLQDSAFPTGIPELDKRGFGPTRKELWVFVANAKRGKSWALVHLAKMALIHQLKVIHISLEMSADRCAQRYFQAMYAVAKRSDKLRVSRFKRDELGRAIGLDERMVIPKLSLQDPEIRQKLEGLIDKWAIRHLDNIYIKDFPTGRLNVGQLRAYLDVMEQNERFVPDLLIIDYPDLMKKDKNQEVRHSLDQIYQDVRGIAVERNIAVAIVSQANKEGEKGKRVSLANLSEAYTKGMHADCVITYSQSETEHSLGLARLYVAAGRNDDDKLELVLCQQYGIGQFVLDSVLKPNDYHLMLPQGGNEDDEV